MSVYAVSQPVCKCGSTIRILLVGNVLVAECRECRTQRPAKDAPQPSHPLLPKESK